MKPIDRKTLAGALILFFVLVGLGIAAGNIGRSMPVDIVKESTYCEVCHSSQVIGMNTTTHLSYFAQTIYGETDIVAVVNITSIVTVEEVGDIAGRCMMCHTWHNR